MRACNGGAVRGEAELRPGTAKGGRNGVGYGAAAVSAPSMGAAVGEVIGPRGNDVASADERDGWLRAQRGGGDPVILTAMCMNNIRVSFGDESP